MRAIVTEPSMTAEQRDELHEIPPDGHTVSIEKSVVCGMPVFRRVCGCGYASEWLHQRLLIEAANVAIDAGGKR
jgi:hypothetical protein